MFKFIFAFCFLSFTMSICSGQTLSWAKKMGGFSNDGGNGVALDASGNVYTTGIFWGTANFDPNGSYNLTSVGEYDVFISKFDSSGNFIWAKGFGGFGSDRSNGIAVDASGNIYTTGYFVGTVNFNPNGNFSLTSGGGLDIFISKFDSSGNFVWAKRIGGTWNDHTSSIALDSYANVYTTGAFGGTVNFNPNGTFNLTSSGNSDIFISKLDSSGNFVWAKKIGGNDWMAGQALTIDNGGNVYTTGFFSGTANFNPNGSFNLTSSGDRDVFVSKLNANGNFVWAKKLGGPSYDNSHSIAVDTFGNVYTAGVFMETSNFNPNGTYNLTAASGTQEIFISKLDPSGNFVWAKKIGGGDINNIHSIALDLAGNIYATGGFYGTSNFNPNGSYYLTSGVGSYDIFICKLDDSGNFIWARKFGGVESSQGYSIVVDNLGNIYTTGSFRGITNFSSPGTYNLSSYGSSDIFVHKMAPCQPTTGTDVVSKCNSYTWIDGKTYYSSNNTATHLLSNSIGCDSLVSLDLTINKSTTGKDVISACNSYTWKNGVTYTASNQSATIKLTNSVGCDSVITLNLTIHPLPLIKLFSDTSVCIDQDLYLDGGAGFSVYEWIISPAGLAFNTKELILEGNTLGIGEHLVSLTVTDVNGCVSKKDAKVNVDPCTGVKNGTEHKNRLLFYPNPASSKITLNITSLAYEEIEIIFKNSNGKIVSKEKFNVNEGQNLKDFDVSTLARGVYFLQVISTEKTINKKLILE